jgi:hypothetical protein
MNTSLPGFKSMPHVASIANQPSYTDGVHYSNQSSMPQVRNSPIPTDEETINSSSSSSSLSSREGVRTLNEAMEMLFTSSLFSVDEKLQRASEFHQIQQNKTAKKVIDFGTLPSSHTDKHSMNPHSKKRRHFGAQKRTEQGRGALITVRGGCIQRLLLCLSDSAKTVLGAFMKRVACIDTCRVHSPVRLHRTHHHHEAKELLLLEATTAI